MPIVRRGHSNQDLNKVRKHDKSLNSVKGTASAIFLRQELAF